MRIANADSEEEMSDEECDVFVLEPHEAVYYKKLREQKMLQDRKRNDDIVAELGAQTLTSIEEDAGLDSEFPSLAAVQVIPTNLKLKIFLATLLMSTRAFPITMLWAITLEDSLPLQA